MSDHGRAPSLNVVQAFIRRHTDKGKEFRLESPLPSGTVSSNIADFYSFDGDLRRRLPPPFFFGCQSTSSLRPSSTRKEHVGIRLDTIR